MGKKKLYDVRSVVDKQSCSKRNKLKNLAEFVSVVEDNYTDRFNHPQGTCCSGSIKRSPRKHTKIERGFTLKLNKPVLSVNTTGDEDLSSEAKKPTNIEVVIPPAILTGNTRGETSKVKEGYVYVVTNPAWEGYVKIGSTLDLSGRLASFNVGSPHGDYELKYYSYVSDRVLEEKTIHKELNEYRASGEWFKLSLDSTIQHIKDRNILRV